MDEEKHRVRRPEGGEGALIAWLKDSLRQLRLAWRLLWDRRVALWTKLIPPVVLTYVILPIDILPHFPPKELRRLDDLAVVLLGVRLFIELAPPEVVREHLESLGVQTQEWRLVGDDQIVVLDQGGGIRRVEVDAEE